MIDFETDWRTNDSGRTELPVALDMAGLYEQMLRRLLPLPPRTGEPLKAQIERPAQLRTLKSQLETLSH